MQKSSLKTVISLALVISLFTSVKVFAQQPSKGTKNIFDVISSFVSSLTFDSKNPQKTFSRKINCPLEDTNVTFERDDGLVGKTWRVLCEQKTFRCNSGTYPIPTVHCSPIEYPQPKIQRGMNKKSVKMVLGEPLRVNKQPTGEQWVYPRGYVHFEDDGVVYTQFY